ncbi:hypothetical protein Tsubulata_026316 [Turnera subulata]|uniref:RING-type E3 ubiquitin transferase n=1 Tax=Turnera subulata TaxID=218843 RepID=A0A9Q0G8B9_9ROSI|nr:hypothetical protein Tsubulata_026316 [Turnera subulata]
MFKVQIPGQLQHSHLVNLLGSCPEAWSLPNGSLQVRLIKSSNILPLTQKIQARTSTEISSAVYCLHSSKLEKIVHGKTTKILHDSSSAARYAKGAYTDPDPSDHPTATHRKASGLAVGDVRLTMSFGKLASISDPSEIMHDPQVAADGSHVKVKPCVDGRKMAVKHLP